MLSHKGTHRSGPGDTSNIAPTPVRRRRRTLGPDARSCPHCGRAFKRTEHLDRHVRTRQLHFNVVTL